MGELVDMRELRALGMRRRDKFQTATGILLIITGKLFTS